MHNYANYDFKSFRLLNHQWYNVKNTKNVAKNE